MKAYEVPDGPAPGALNSIQDEELVYDARTNALFAAAQVLAGRMSSASTSRFYDAGEVVNYAKRLEVYLREGR